MSSLKTLQQLQPQVFDGIQVEIPSSEAGQIQTRHNEPPKHQITNSKHVQCTRRETTNATLTKQENMSTKPKRAKHCFMHVRVMRVRFYF